MPAATTPPLAFDLPAPQSLKLRRRSNVAAIARSLVSLARSPTPPVWLSYVVPALSVAVALGIALLLDAHFVSAPVSLVVLAIMFSTWYGGPRPGLLAAAASNLAVIYCFVEPVNSFAVAAHAAPRVILVVLATLCVTWLTSAQRAAAASLRTARDELNRNLQELRTINETLRAENAQRRSAEQALEGLPGRLINAQEQERRRIGRELHDHIIQTLCLLTIKIDQLRANREIKPSIDGVLAELRRDTSEIIDDVHGISHRLHPSTLEFLGLVPALQSLVSELAERHGIAITFTHASVPAALSPDVALCLFRVAEEALTNIAKHSRAPSASIQIIGADDGLHLRVEDAGTGFEMAALAGRAGLGFVSMQERLRVIHGTFRVDSAPTRGTRIFAWVPYGR